jgi:TPR repeat protein
VRIIEVGLIAGRALMDIQALRRKAEAGSCVAQSLLGISYLYGHDVEVDYSEAFKFLAAAAKQGSARATLSLGIMYAKGLGIPLDLPEAIRLIEAVATPSESSDAFAARIELGRIYSSGTGITADKAKALAWYEAAIAIANGSEDSAYLREAKEYVARADRNL